MLRLHTRMQAEYNGLLESLPACSSYGSLTVLNLVVGNIPLGAAVTTMEHSGTLIAVHRPLCSVLEVTVLGKVQKVMKLNTSLS